MNKETLLRRKAETEKRFDELTKQKTDIDTEIVAIQGEHRLLVSLLADFDAPIEKPKKRISKKIEVQDATS